MAPHSATPELLQLLNSAFSELCDLRVFVVILTLCALLSLSALSIPPSVSSPVRFELSQIRSILDRLSGQLTWR